MATCMHGSGTIWLKSPQEPKTSPTRGESRRPHIHQVLRHGCQVLSILDGVRQREAALAL